MFIILFPEWHMSFGPHLCALLVATSTDDLSSCSIVRPKRTKDRRLYILRNSNRAPQAALSLNSPRIQLPESTTPRLAFSRPF